MDNNNNKMMTNNNQNVPNHQQQQDRILMLKHDQLINYIINNKHLVHPNIDLDRMDTNEIILFDKYESIIQLNKDKKNNNIFYSIKTILILMIPNQ